MLSNICFVSTFKFDDILKTLKSVWQQGGFYCDVYPEIQIISNLKKKKNISSLDPQIYNSEYDKIKGWYSILLPIIKK